MAKKKQTLKERIGFMVNVVTIGMAVKSSVWDRLSDNQKQRIIVSAQGAALRAKDKGVDVFSLLKQKKNDLVKK